VHQEVQMIKAPWLFALVVLGTLVVGGYMVVAPDRPSPPYLTASLD